MKNRITNALRDWRQAKKLTAFGGFLFIIALIPNWVSVGRFWYAVGHWGWLRISWLSTGWGRVSLVVVGVAIILLDQRRSKNPKSHNAKTVKGRTLQLRDDLQKLLEDATTRWPEYIQGKTATPYDDSVLTNAFKRGSYIQHTFALKFASRAEIIYHECGLAGTTNDALLMRLGQGIASATKLRELIGDLDWMANHTE